MGVMALQIDVTRDHVVALHYPCGCAISKVNKSSAIAAGAPDIKASTAVPQDDRVHVREVGQVEIHDV